jgi:hypothetical protein
MSWSRIRLVTSSIVQEPAALVMHELAKTSLLGCFHVFQGYLVQSASRRWKSI